MLLASLFLFLHNYCNEVNKNTMKKLLIILFFVFVSQQISYGQSDSITKFSINDSIVYKIYSLFPAGWTFIQEGDKFIIQRTDSIYSLEEYRFGSSHSGETKDERNIRIQKEGKKSISRIILRYEDRWSYLKAVGTKNSNILYKKELSNLAEKHKITKLYNQELSTRQNPVYTGTTEEEKDAIKKFEKERSEIQAKIYTLPNYNTEKYSIFLISFEGGNDDNHYIFPEEASLQLYSILALFYEYAGH